MPEDEQLKPICFMVMPFRTKKVRDPKGEGAPAEVDCDALWEKAFRPAIEQLGYIAVRADYDPGSVIVKDMLERLAYADLVLADVSLPNGNVYYEVGLRHVAKKTSCVLLAANWSKQLFDIDQFTAVRYELSDGSVPDAQAQAIRQAVVDNVPNLRDSPTPYHEFISADSDQGNRKGVFRDQAQRLSDFQASVLQGRIVAPPERKAYVEKLLEDLPESALRIGEVATELLCLVRDAAGWQAMLRFSESLPTVTANLPFIREQTLLAVGKGGEPEEAIAKLQRLIADFGDSEERRGLIGGRYKTLWREAKKARVQAGEQRASAVEKRHLQAAIDSYTAGMELDYNAYYCSCNLPALFVERNRPGNPKKGTPSDRERAQLIDHFVVAACKRVLARGEADTWLRPTLLGSAFRAADAEEARELADQVQQDGPADWMLETVLKDLELAVTQVGDDEQQQALRDIYDELEQAAAEL